MRMCQNPPFITQSKRICGEHLIDPLYVTGEQEKYAYIRISTSKQKLDRQINNIRQHYNIPPDNFICEIYTGTEMNRPEWKKLREKLKSGDTVIFDSVSRMSRNADEGIADYMDLYNKGIELIFINEPHINTAKYREATNQAKQNPVRIDVSTGDKKIDELLSFMQDWVNDFMLHIISRDIRAEFEKAENEIADLSRRTKEGMRAKGAGNKISDARTGKKYRTAESMRNRITILERSAKFGGILTESDLAKIIGISRRTVSRYSAEMTEELSTITKDELLAKLKKEVQNKHKI